MSNQPTSGTTELPWIEPKFIDGGCLCGAVRYHIDFPAGHDFRRCSGSCQCTQCRRNTSSLFFLYHRVPLTAVTWLPPTLSSGSGDDGTKPRPSDWDDSSNPPPAALTYYQASPAAERAFCVRCGSMLYWHRRGTGEVSFAVGTIDPLYLFGEGAKETARTEGGQTVPETGFGNVLINCNGHNEYVCCEIKGVTDDMALLRRGDRFETE